ncbi:MAG TPA: chorismate mutase [Acidimicrobiales bacterium]|nr:chorismate mutase [Acidimicrobiales bacterium]
MTQVRAIRGATTLDEDTIEQLNERVPTLVSQMMSSNALVAADLISILFTATSDIRAGFPAAAARTLGLSDTPVMCAREMEIPGSLGLCVRVMMHAHSDRAKDEMVHVYLHGARVLRPDLVATVEGDDR